jgi:hypothetical protein
MLTTFVPTECAGRPGHRFQRWYPEFLVVLPLAFAVPDGLPSVPAIVVAQTLLELLSELGLRSLHRPGSAQLKKVWLNS